MNKPIFDVQIIEGYLTFTMNGHIIYDFPQNQYQEFLPRLREKNWFEGLEEKCNSLCEEVLNG